MGTCEKKFALVYGVYGKPMNSIINVPHLWILNKAILRETTFTWITKNFINFAEVFDELRKTILLLVKK